MITAITLISILFVGIGFIVTDNNAKYLLSGYNTMSETAKSNFDIKSYIPYFRRFHIYLGFSLFLIGLLLYYFVNPDWTAVFMVLYPILAYVYFIAKGGKFLKQKDSKQKRKRMLAMGIMLATLFGLSGMFLYSLRDNTIVIKDHVIEIKGDYGIELKIDDIKTIVLVDSIPNLSKKLNGFALTNVKKGDFETTSGEKIKLLINVMSRPFLYIQMKDNFRIYYTAKGKSIHSIFKELESAIHHSNKLEDTDMFCYFSLH